MDKNVNTTSIKYVYGLVGSIGLILAAVVAYKGHYLPPNVILLCAQILGVALMICAGILFFLMGVFLLRKTYDILKKPFKNYQEDFQAVGADRILTRKQDVVADKIGSGAMLGGMGVLCLFIAIGFLKIIVIDFLWQLIVRASF